MSLKDEIKGNIRNFTDPMKQSIKNLIHIKDDISDTIADKMDETKEGIEETTQDQPKEKGGCLKKALVYGFVIIAIVAFLRNGCSFNSTIERDNAGGETTSSQSDASNESQSLYNQYVQMTEDNIATLVTQETIDIDALEDEYEFLLTCLVSEYMFKSMAHGHFTRDYETTQYDYIPKKCGEITTEMKKYIDTNFVESMFTAIMAEAYESFDDSVFNYDSCLVGTTETPNIDAMWESYFDSLAGAVG